MSAPDPLTTGLVIQGAGQVLKQAEDFVSAAAGTPGVSLGTMFGTFVHQRLKNLAEVGNKANLIP
jgi:hypothetical protein